MAWNKSTTDTQPEDEVQTTPAPRSRSEQPAVLGASITIKGDLEGREDLTIEGRVEGKVSLPKQTVIVGQSGRIRADIHARQIRVEGKVEGNLYGEELVLITPSGKLIGNIVSPSVTLENGSKFRGAIDMEPQTAPKLGPAKPSKAVSAADSGDSKSDEEPKKSSELSASSSGA